MSVEKIREALESVKWDCENCDWSCLICGRAYDMTDTDLYNTTRNTLALAQRLEAALPALVKAAENFVNKCETGRAYSKESYREFKAALSLLQAEKKI